MPRVTQNITYKYIGAIGGQAETIVALLHCRVSLGLIRRPSITRCRLFLSRFNTSTNQISGRSGFHADSWRRPSLCIITACLESSLTRRNLLRSAAGFSALSYNRILGANNRVQLGLIGCGGRGRHVMETFTKTDQVEVPAVCDVWPERSQQAKKVAVNAQALHRSPEDAGRKGSRCRPDRHP